MRLYEHFNPVVYDMVPEGARVLDMGCASGVLGSRLIAHKGCEVYGIDMEHDALKMAARRGLITHALDLNTAEELPFERHSFDCVVLADVLEHLLSPERVLRMVRGYVAQGGCIVVSLPNIAFIFIRLMLLLGRFEMQDEGILDRTHLHFYTLDSARRLISGCGYRVVHTRALAAVRRRYALLRYLAPLRPQLFSPQLVFKAVPEFL